jgi:type IV pilus assembly protein PilP
MKRNQSRAVIAAALLLAFSGGCKKEKPPEPPQPKQVAPKPVKANAPVQNQVSSATLLPGAHLDFRNRTDPFKPPAAALPPAGPAAPQPGGGAPRPAVAPSADLLPIQSYDVGRFKVVGIIAGLRQNRALMIDPAGKGYVVQEGMVIGSNNGRIARITASSVEVIETFKADNGRIRKRKIVLTLAKKR